MTAATAFFLVDGACSFLLGLDNFFRSFRLVFLLLLTATCFTSILIIDFHVGHGSVPILAFLLVVTATFAFVRLFICFVLTTTTATGLLFEVTTTAMITIHNSHPGHVNVCVYF